MRVPCSFLAVFAWNSATIKNFLITKNVIIIVTFSIHINVDHILSFVKIKFCNFSTEGCSLSLRRIMRMALSCALGRPGRYPSQKGTEQRHKAHSLKEHHWDVFVLEGPKIEKPLSF